LVGLGVEAAHEAGVVRERVEVGAARTVPLELEAAEGALLLRGGVAAAHGALESEEGGLLDLSRLFALIKIEVLLVVLGL